MSSNIRQTRTASRRAMRGVTTMAFLCATLALSACGGSSSSSSSAITSPAATDASTASSATAPTSGTPSNPTPVPASSASASPSVTHKARLYTMAQVADHKTSTSCWTEIDANVYDLTSWISRHPGGRRHILALCGKDGTPAFEAQHSADSRPKQVLATYKIGILAK